MSALNVKQIRQDFPNLQATVHGKPLVYLDNAATTLKPRQVIDAVSDHYSNYTSNVHRGVHALSEKATAKFEAARKTVQTFLNAKQSQEIIFTRGTTESINLVAYSYGRHFLNEGDEILISEMEHHSNIVPWQILCEEKKCRLRVLPMNDDGELLMDKLDALLTDKTKLVSIVHISNSLGTVNPIKSIIAKAHERGIPVLIDAAQSANHTALDVQDLDCDFLVLSSHKIFGPTGVGVLYGKEEWLERMPPFHGGGDMIASVTFEKTTYNSLPYKFEAGTPNVAGVIGFGAALEYISQIGLEHIEAYKQDLLDYGTRQLQTIDGLRLIGTAKDKASVLSFLLPDIHAHDVGTLVDNEGIAIRTGHHCTQPVMIHFGIPATSRASLAMYNTREEIDLLVAALKKTIQIFK